MTHGTKTFKYVLRDDRILLHDLEVLSGDDVPVTGGGNKNVGARSSFLHSSDLVTSHSSLKSVDGVDLSDDDTSSI